MGRSDINLNIELLKKIMEISVLLLVMRHGVMAIALSMIFISVVSQIINSFPNKKLIDYSYVQQLKDIFPEIMLAIVMGLAVYMLGFWQINDLLLLAVQVAVGATIYIGASMIFKLEAFVYLKEKVLNR